MNNDLFEIGTETITIFHRNHVWELKRPTNQDWDEFQRLKHTDVQVLSKTVETEVDDYAAKFSLFKDLIVGIYKPDMTPAIENQNGWKDATPPNVRLEVIGHLTAVQVLQEDESGFTFGAATQDVVIEAFQHKMIKTETADEVNITHKLKKIPIRFTFKTPSSEETREFKRVTQGKTTLDRRTRKNAKVVREDLAGIRKLFSKLILNISGYSFLNEPVIISTPEMIASYNIDSIHKMVALSGLFETEEIEEKN